jgi:hypothetical protein
VLAGIAAAPLVLDLRGFTWNQGCVFELTWLVQRIPLPRIVLLTDKTTDFEGLEKTVQTAWASLPSTSPNADGREALITVFNANVRSRESKRALFTLLLSAACCSEAVPASI